MADRTRLASAVRSRPTVRRQQPIAVITRKVSRVKLPPLPTPTSALAIRTGFAVTPLRRKRCYTIVGMVPIIEKKMRLVQAADAIEVTGLTRNQLREWTSRGRREILTADVEPEGPGRHALFSWQTLLVLRVLLVLHNDFACEIGAWGASARNLRRELEKVSFASLWRSGIHFSDCRTVAVIDNGRTLDRPGIFVPLEPHLQLLADKLSLPRPDQLSLLPPMLVSR